jgi:hypothetical protein
VVSGWRVRSSIRHVIEWDGSQPHRVAGDDGTYKGLTTLMLYKDWPDIGDGFLDTSGKGNRPHIRLRELQRPANGIRQNEIGNVWIDDGIRANGKNIGVQRIN